jgi:hypothetical protein
MGYVEERMPAIYELEGESEQQSRLNSLILESNKGSLQH